jgi:hypothetical protein
MNGVKEKNNATEMTRREQNKIRQKEEDKQ